MAFSQHQVTDLTAVAANGASATTLANASNPNGPIIDYPGMVQNCLLKTQELKTALNEVIAVTDAGTDATNLALLQSVVNDLV